MSLASPLDLRRAIGALLAALGLLLASYGALTRNARAAYAMTGGNNINLVWGLVMLAVGAAFLLAAAWHRRSARPGARPSVADRDTGGRPL